MSAEENDVAGETSNPAEAGDGQETGCCEKTS